MIRWRRAKRKEQELANTSSSPELAAAERAKSEAERKLAETQKKQDEINQVTNIAKAICQQNSFGLALDLAFGRAKIDRDDQ